MLLQTTKHSPSRPLSEAAQKHFDRIILGREIETWSEADLVVSTNLAQALSQIDELNDYLSANGLVDEQGTPRKAIAAVCQLQGVTKALMTTLGLSASQRAVSGSRQAVRNKHERDLRNSMSSFADGSASMLLA
jgi:hypothetical protein